jgi:hypothetical protein
MEWVEVQLHFFVNLAVDVGKLLAHGPGLDARKRSPIYPLNRVI